MKYVSIVDVKDKLEELFTYIEANPDSEVFITFNGKPIIKMSPVDVKTRVAAEKKNNPDYRRFGIAKGKFTFDDDVFMALDEEIDKMFYGEEKQ